MDFSLSRRDFGRILAGTAATVACSQLGRSAADATPVAGYKAMVGLFLTGGNDGWNMVVPTDARYAGYASSRGSLLALPSASLNTLAGTAFALHPALDPLRAIWDEGALNLVLNTGTLYCPLTKAQYLASPELRPINLMSHSDEQAHWQGMRAREENSDGFMGRLTDRTAQPTVPNLISFAGASLAVLGRNSSPLILPSKGSTVQTGATARATDPVIFARRSGVSTFADATGMGTITDTTSRGITSAYGLAVSSNTILTATGSAVDQYFVDSNGAALTSDISQQLKRTARMIEARSTLGHSRQTFMVSQGGYDTHAGQATIGDTTTGTQATLFTDLAWAIAGFYNAMKALGLSENVTLFTMSDFGRTYKGNAQSGSDHAWGNNHMVIGGALNPRVAHGAYPSTVLGGADDITSEGRFIPTTAQEEYIGAIAKWHGVADADMSYVFPNWSTWNSGGRGPLPLFQS